MSQSTWSFYATIVYFCLYTVLILLISLYIHKKETPENRKAFIKAIWDRKSIYGQILVHVYDTATDIGVLIAWYLLANDDIDYKSIDMHIMFWTAIGFQIGYRLFSCCFAGASSLLDDQNFMLIPDMCLGLLDMYILKTVYLSLKLDYKEPTARQKAIQLMESIFESLPQVVLQSVFIIRSVNDDRITEKSDSVTLVGVSLIASVFSISNKYAWLDKEGVVDEAKKPQFSTSWPCINGWYVLRIIWRFSFVATRFCALSLMWSVVGGWFLCIFMFVSVLMWNGLFIEEEYEEGECDQCCPKLCRALHAISQLFTRAMWGLSTMVATPATNKQIYCVVHGVEMCVTLSVITFFAYTDTVNCIICADPERRQANANVFIKWFIRCGWVALLIDLIAYVILMRCEMFSEKTHGWMKQCCDGFDKIIKEDDDDVTSAKTTVNDEQVTEPERTNTVELRVKDVN
eukprot:38169_1